MDADTPACGVCLTIGSDLEIARIILGWMRENSWKPCGSLFWNDANDALVTDLTPLVTPFDGMPYGTGSAKVRLGLRRIKSIIDLVNHLIGRE